MLKQTPTPRNPQAIVATPADEGLVQFDLKPLNDAELIKSARQDRMNRIVTVTSTKSRKQTFVAPVIEKRRGREQFLAVKSTNSNVSDVPRDDTLTNQAVEPSKEVAGELTDEPAGFVTLRLKPMFGYTADYQEAEATGSDAGASTDKAPKMVGSAPPEIPQPGFVPLNQVDLIAAVRTPKTENPKYREPTDLAALINGQYAPIHNWGAPQWYTFKPNRNTFPFKHNPLYFEDANLERCGQSTGCLTNFNSAVHFFSTVPKLPGLMLGQHPRDCVCARPDCPTCHEFKDAP